MDVVGALPWVSTPAQLETRQVSVPCMALRSTGRLRLFKASRSGYQHALGVARSIEPTFLSLRWRSPRVLSVSSNR